MDQRYDSGEEIHAGDRVLYGGSRGVIVFVVDRKEYSAEFSEEYWGDSGTGFMIQTQMWGLMRLDAADEDLELISRAIKPE
jgi:hypothetical protein